MGTCLDPAPRAHCCPFCPTGTASAGTGVPGTGLLSSVERKNGWQLAEQAREATPYGMQRLLSAAVWDTDGVRNELRSYVLEHLGREAATVVIDETSFPKRGKKSAGVGPHYCGTTGQVENCQVGVFLSYVTSQGHSLIDRELYLPADWINDRERCQEAGIPESVRFQTKPELAVQMIERLWRAQVPIVWVVADTVYGGILDLRTWLEAHEYSYVLAVACNEPVAFETSTGRRREEAGMPRTMGLGRKRSVVATPLDERGHARAHGCLIGSWCLCSIGGRDDGCHWLLIRRSLSDPNDKAYYARLRPQRHHAARNGQGNRWQMAY